MKAIEFIEENYTLINGGEDYMCNQSGELVGAEDIAEAYHEHELKLLDIPDVNGSNIDYKQAYHELYNNTAKMLVKNRKFNWHPQVLLGMWDNLRK